MTGASGNVLDSQAYGAFGTNAAGGQNGKVSNDHLYAGEQLDPTGLYFNRARYYNPNIGRFIGRDSLKGDLNSPIAQNKFIYVENNPINFIDPSGYKSNDAIERQVTARACSYAMDRGLEPLCDIPSSATLYTVKDNITGDSSEMVLEQKEANDYPSLRFTLVQKPRPSWGSRSSVTFLKYIKVLDKLKKVVGGIADILTLVDIPSIYKLLSGIFRPDLCNDNMVDSYSGVYEVEPDDNPNEGRRQRNLYLAFLQAEQFTANNKATLENHKWIPGVGMLSFRASFIIMFPTISYYIDAKWSEAGLILFSKEKIGMNTNLKPSPSPTPQGCYVTINGRLVCPK